jgi:Calcineurin-like phosphoesterase
MPATAPPSLEELAKYPTMTRWFRPGLLAKLLWRVIVAELFGQYADRRLIVAALDTVSDDELVERAQQFAPGSGNDDCTLTPDAEGAIWIDYVADLGDGFDATYAIASLLAQETLTIAGHTTRRGQILIMGGDEVYPNASPETYQRQLRDPYDWAFPDPLPNSSKGPPVYAIPGNHDWYDGLVLFLALFSRKENLHLGGWRSHQRRSYFALRLTEKWWVWAVDAQLEDDVDQPQRDYFSAIARGMPEGANIILCGPEPGWLYTLKQGNKSLAVIDDVGWIALNKHKGLKIPLVLSGDTHHYSRYAGDDGVTQFITSGGGGAFLHSTHQLELTIDLDRAKDGFAWLGGRVKTLSLGRDPNPANAASPGEARYPTREESLAMLTGNFKFSADNPGFAILLGVLYWLLGLVTVHFHWDGICATVVLLLLGFWFYTKRQEGGGVKVLALTGANAVVHSIAVIVLASSFDQANANYLHLADWPRLSFLLFAGEMIVVGGLLAAALFGVYLYASSRWWNRNHNDAFSAMRLDSHRNFLRLRIKDDAVTIYPIGLDRVPRRNEWRRNSERQGSPPPAYVAVSPLMPRLIEGPLTVRSA